MNRIIIIHALDLLYFWMYLPRARIQFKALIRSMSVEELQIILRSQSVLNRQREISQLLVDGFVGKNFSRPLSFYLDRSKDYLASIEKIIGTQLNLLSPAVTETSLPM